MSMQWSSHLEKLGLSDVLGQLRAKAEEAHLCARGLLAAARHAGSHVGQAMLVCTTGSGKRPEVPSVV